MLEKIEAVGCMQKTMVADDAEHFQDKINRINQVKENFVQLIQEIMKQIHELDQ